MPEARRNDTDEYVRAGGPYAELIRGLVESGRFENAAEVVLEGLSLLRDRELLRKAREQDLAARIHVAIDQAERGELIPAEEVFEQLSRKYQAMAEKQDRP